MAISKAAAAMTETRPLSAVNRAPPPRRNGAPSSGGRAKPGGTYWVTFGPSIGSSNACSGSNAGGRTLVGPSGVWYNRAGSASQPGAEGEIAMGDDAGDGLESPSDNDAGEDLAPPEDDSESSDLAPPDDDGADDGITAVPDEADTAGW